MDWDQYCDISVYNIDDYMNDSNKKHFRKKENIEVNTEDSDESISEFGLIMSIFYKCIGVILCIKGLYYFKSSKKK